MCGILGIYGNEDNSNIEIYEGLQALQHRGQDSVGIANENIIIKALQDDLGKPELEAYATEVGFVLREITLFINNTIKMSGVGFVRAMNCMLITVIANEAPPSFSANFSLLLYSMPFNAYNKRPNVVRSSPFTGDF